MMSISSSADALASFSQRLFRRSFQLEIGAYGEVCLHARS